MMCRGVRRRIGATEMTDGEWTLIDADLGGATDSGTPSSKRVSAVAAGQAAVILICDRNYIMPTLGAALSAETHTSADVRIDIFVVDANEAWKNNLAPAVSGTRIALNAVALPELAEIARYHNDRYLPPIVLARLWLDELLAPGITRFLYIDGDTMVDGSLDDLLAVCPPAGQLMAVPDAIAIYFDEASRNRERDRAYLAGLSCTGSDYFNSGVLYASREAWAEIAADAKAFLVGHPELCRSSDQSALNRAARGRLTLLPLRYNYQSEHMIALDPRDRGLLPVIWHFTGAPKPWEADIWPWDVKFARYYAEAESRLAGTGTAAPVTPEPQADAGIAHRRRARARLTYLYPWRYWTRGRRIVSSF
jgi:lipopolysaccharide biosynthesis glycosyltransferase